MIERPFVDTNILIYAHDRADAKKQRIAKELVRKLWERSQPPTISIQVLQEFYVNLRKFVNIEQISEIIEIYKEWTIIENTLATFEKAIEIQKKSKLSFWDSSILSAAVIGKANILYSEDLNHGQMIQGIRIMNPFL